MKYNLFNMMALDIFLSSVSKRKFEEMYSEIQGDIFAIPLMSWDIYSSANSEKLLEAERLQDITKVKLLASKFKWENNIDSIFENEQFEAILITDINQEILWVNNGFSNMTGFSKTEALGNTPRFLQGPKTSVMRRQSIRKKLSANLPFKEVIVNHKKDGTSYECEVKIFPLNKNDNKTHYIALERKVG